MKLAVLAHLLASIGMSDTPVYTDMVLVEAPRPFLIDIFEATKPNGKAFRHKDIAESVKYCKDLGKRLATEEEWLAAARNVRGKVARNQNYTLRGDQLYKNSRAPKPEELLANVMHTEAEGGSANPADFEKVGIDAVGTVGMTGNRAEWVLGSGNKAVQCGGAYETTKAKIDSIRLDHICTDKPADWPVAGDDVPTATARCVVDVDPSVGAGIRYSEKVQGELRNYLSQLETNRPESSGANVVSELSELIRLLITVDCPKTQTPAERLARPSADGPLCSPDSVTPAPKPVRKKTK